MKLGGVFEGSAAWHGRLLQCQHTQKKLQAKDEAGKGAPRNALGSVMLLVR